MKNTFDLESLEKVENDLIIGFENVLNYRKKSGFKYLFNPIAYERYYERYKECCLACGEIIDGKEWTLIDDINSIVTDCFCFEHEFPWDIARVLKDDVLNEFDDIKTIDDWFDTEPGEIGNYILDLIEDDNRKYKKELNRRNFTLGKRTEKCL